MLSLVKLETTMFLLPFWLKICEETTIVGVQAGMFFYVKPRANGSNMLDPTFQMLDPTCWNRLCTQSNMLDPTISNDVFERWIFVFER